MLALASRVLCVGALATVGVIACAPATSDSLRQAPHPASPLPITATSRVIDAQRIQRSGSITALDAIRALVPGYRSLETQPFGMGGLGTSAMPRGALRVLVDGHPAGDVESLRMIPADEVLAIHVLSGPDATMRFGSSYTGGVIIVQTMATLRRL